MVHITLGNILVNAVDTLCIRNRSQSSNSQYLGLTSGKQTGAVYPGQNAYLCCQGTDLVNAAAVHTLALIEPVADNLLLQLVDALVNHRCLVRIIRIKLLVNIVLDGVEPLLTDVLVVGIQRKLHPVGRKGVNGIKEIVIHFHGFKGKLRLADLLLDVLDERNHLLVFSLAGQNRLHHGSFVHFVGACFDHDNLLVRAGNGQVQVVLPSLLQRGVQHDLPVHQADTDAGNGAVPGNVRNGNGNGGGDHTHNLRRMIRIHSQNRHYHGDVVAHILGEQGADRPVHHTGGEDSLFTGLALPLHKAAGDLAYRIQPLFIIHGKGEKVDTLPGLCACCNIRHHNAAAVANPAGAIRQLTGLSGFHGQFPARKHGLEHFIIFEHNCLLYLSGSLSIKPCLRTENTVSC